MSRRGVLVTFAVTATASASVQAAPDPTPDAAFQDHVRTFATRSHRTLETWGTAHLARGKEATRFAILEEAPVVGQTGASSCGDHDCRGAYVLEAAADAIWLITFDERRAGPDTETMRVAAWRGDWYPNEFELTAGTSPKSGEPTWQVLDDPALRYKAMHNHGQLDVLFGLRDGKPVVFELDDSNREDTRVKYAKNGTCTHACPTVASFTYAPKAAASDARAVMHMFMNPAVSGPAKWADLREPAAPDAVP